CRIQQGQFLIHPMRPDRILCFWKSPGLALNHSAKLCWMVAGLMIPFLVTAAPRPLLRQNVPVSAGNLQPLTRLDRELSLDLIVGLPLRDPEGLRGFIERVYNPATPDYHRFLTPEEFTAKFSPSEGDYRSVVEFLKTNGFVITSLSTNRLLIDVRGTVD